jgi:hypothetical protein
MSIDLKPRTDTPVAPPELPKPGRNLLDRPLVNRFVRSRWYPGVFQWIAAAVFVVVVYQLLLGPDTAHDNLGTALVWVLWWPLIPILFIAVGRFWCAVCPFGKLSDLVQRLVGVNRPVPAFLKSTASGSSTRGAPDAARRDVQGLIGAQPRAPRPGALLGVLIAPVFGRVAGVFVAFLIPFLDGGVGQSPMFRSEPANWAQYLLGYGAYRILIDGGLTTGRFPWR